MESLILTEDLSEYLPNTIRTMSHNTEEIEKVTTEDNNLPTGSSSFQTSVIPVPRTRYLICKVCGDRASGKHYGIAACHGCRSFFRRAVSRTRKHVCDFGEDCIVSVEERAQCKACRYKKCLQVGMKPEDVATAVIYFKSHEKNRGNLISLLSIDDSTILRSTQSLSTCNLMENFYISQHASSGIQIPYADDNILLTDWPTYALSCHNTWQAEVMSMVEWSKRIPGFKELDIGDQILLLKASATRHIFLWGAFQTIRSSPDGDVPYILLRNFKASIHCGDVNYYGENRIGDTMENGMVRFYNTIVKPLRNSKATDKEILCLETLLLLDHNIPDLLYPDKVMKLRRNIQDLITNEGKVDPAFLCQLMDLHLLIPNLDAVTAVIIKESYKIFKDWGRIVKVLEELVFFECLNQI